MTQPTSRVLAILHEERPDRRELLGSLLPALLRRGLDVVDVARIDPTRTPPPEAFSHIVLLGSPSSIHDNQSWIQTELAYATSAITAGVPILGICFGGQLLARALGGNAKPNQEPTFGFVRLRSSMPALVGDGPWMYHHSDAIIAPPSASVISESQKGVDAFMSGPHLGLQFHPEITPTAFRMWRRSATLLEAAAAEQLHRHVRLQARHSAHLCDELVQSFLGHARSVARTNHAVLSHVPRGAQDCCTIG